MGANVRFFSATFFGFPPGGFAAIDCIRVTQRHDEEVAGEAADQALKKKEFGPPVLRIRTVQGRAHWITVAEPIWWRAQLPNATICAACTIHFTGCPIITRRHAESTE